jgi:MFS family permease
VPIGALFGALVGGYWIDKIGRLKMFLIDLFLFVISAILMAVAINFPMAFVFRVLTGIGVGLDYPVALAFLAELSYMGQRVKYTSVWLMMTFIGMISAYFVAIPLHFAAPGSPDLWRWVIGIGAAPAIVVLILRYRYMGESPLWLSSRGDLIGAAEAFNKMYAFNLKATANIQPELKNIGFRTYAELFKQKFKVRGLDISLLCALSSFGYFAVGFYAPIISLLILPQGFIYALIGGIIINGFATIASPIPSFLYPKYGIRKVTIVGTFAQVLILAVVGFIPSVSSSYWAVLLLALYMAFHVSGLGNSGLSMAALSYPTRIRGTAAGWGQTMVRVGSIGATVLFPLVVAWAGFAKTMLFIALCPLAALILLLVIKWEPVGKNTEIE